MKEILFFKILIFCVITILEYMLSSYFITSFFNFKLLDGKYEEILINGYKGLSASFSLHTIIFLVFVVTIFIYIYNSNLTFEIDNDTNNTNINNIENSIKEHSSNSNNNQINIGDIQMDFNHIESEQRNIQKTSNSNEQQKENRLIQIDIYIMIISFVSCEFFYFLDIILISSNYQELNDKDNNLSTSSEQYLFLKKIYVEVLAVGYIFFFLFLFLTVFAFIMERFKIFNDFFTNFKADKCKQLEHYFDKYIKNSESMLKKTNEKMDEEIKKLKEYKNKLFDKLNKPKL